MNVYIWGVAVRYSPSYGLDTAVDVPYGGPEVVGVPAGRRLEGLVALTQQVVQ